MNKVLEDRHAGSIQETDEPSLLDIIFSTLHHIPQSGGGCIQWITREIQQRSPAIEKTNTTLNQV
jgi:hypothetical protein